MEYGYGEGKIRLDKELNVLDEFVLGFTAILGKVGIRYVLMSGYVVLLFGRPRITEDVDIFIEEIDEKKLFALYKELQKDHWIINAGSWDTLKLLFQHNDPFRVARKNEISPNMEVKKPRDALGFLSLSHPVEVTINKKHKINISPLELQVAYKLYLGSKKDWEDARYLFDIFKEHLDQRKIVHFAKKLKVSSKLHNLGGSFA
ncbi:MAG TPA: hypothetical protein VJH24_00800 [Candidatus Bilamarchaeaceae archaeon]|nr:hypothetical protein [Candidatus Bilamarchaeaceae archaeon]